MPTELRRTRRKTKFVDVNFESLVRKVERCLAHVTRALKDGRAIDELQEEFYAICRAIRAAKMDFFNVLRPYGLEYKDNYDRFVKLAKDAAKVAKASPFTDVSHSLERHAHEIETARDTHLRKVRNARQAESVRGSSRRLSRQRVARRTGVDLVRRPR